MSRKTAQNYSITAMLYPPQCVFVCLWVCMFVFVLHPLLFLYKKGRARALISECETNQGDFTIWIYFLPSNLIEEISPNTEGLSENASAWKR